MAAPLDLAATKDALVVLATAGILVPLMRRLRISSALGFLVAGALLGPSGLGSLAALVPGLGYVTISGREQIAGIAEFGIVFLLFVIGLELSLPRLLTMRRLVFGLGSLQLGLSAVAIGTVAALLGAPPAAAIAIGAGLALSSTAIVVEMLAGQRRLASGAGRASFAILLFQDLAVVPILFLVDALGTRAEGSLVLDLVLALAQGAAALALIVAAGRLLLAPLFRVVAGADSPEMFMAATLLVAVGTGVLAASAGLPMTLGAFVAGLLLAETEYRRAVEATIEPFKGLLLGVFFFSVGMGLEIGAVLRDPLPLLLCALGLVALKAAILVPLARLFGLSWPVAAECGLILAPGGEFAFVVIGLALGSGLLSPELGAFAATLATLTMTTIPALGWAARRNARRAAKRAPPEAESAPAPPGDGAGRAIVVGFGRVGQIVCAMLERHEVPHLAVDRDAAAVARWRRVGRESVYYGDGANPLFLRSCGIQDAAAVIVTVDEPAAIDAVVRAARGLREDLVIVARARDAEHARRLYGLGATDAVPETIEASLQLAEAALVDIGVPTGLVIASIHEKRDEFRALLQAPEGARRERRAIRARSRRGAPGRA